MISGALELAHTMCDRDNYVRTRRSAKSAAVSKHAWQEAARSMKLLDLLCQTIGAIDGESDSEANALQRKATRLVFTALASLVRDSRESENYVARTEIERPGDREPAHGIELLFEQAGHFVEAAGCVNTLLSNNKVLLEEYVKQHGRRFIELIHAQGPRCLS